MKKRNLLKELNIKEQSDPSCTPLDINIDHIKERVNSRLDFADTQRRSTTMKAKKKIFAAVAIAATLSVGTIVFAITGQVSSQVGGSLSRPDYKSLPTAERVVKDVGYTPVLIDTFKNGYHFEEGSIVNNKLKDQDGNVVEKFKSLSFDYKKGDDTVIFSQDKHHSQTNQSGTVISTVKGTEIYYSHYTNKCVPEDYQLTDEDKEAEASGTLVFSYGTSEVEVSKVQSVTWKKDGIQYQLMQRDGKLSSDELIDMAAEIINKTDKN